MSTRSRVGVLRKKGDDHFVESIYVHFDGYPSGVGKTLVDHWWSVDKVDDLMALGDLSVLGEEIGRRREFYADTGGTPTEEERKMCLAYGRDRDEEDVSSVTHHFSNPWPDYGQEYEYIGTPQETLTGDTAISWQVREAAYGGRIPGVWTPVTEAIEKEDE